MSRPVYTTTAPEDGSPLSSGAVGLPPGAPAWVAGAELPAGMASMDLYALWVDSTNRARDGIARLSVQDRARFGPLGVLRQPFTALDEVINASRA